MALLSLFFFSDCSIVALGSIFLNVETGIILPSSFVTHLILLKLQIYIYHIYVSVVLSPCKLFFHLAVPCVLASFSALHVSVAFYCSITLRHVFPYAGHCPG